MNDKPAKPAIEMVTLKQLGAELKSTHVKHVSAFGSRFAMQRRTRTSQVT